MKEEICFNHPLRIRWSQFTELVSTKRVKVNMVDVIYVVVELVHLNLFQNWKTCSFNLTKSILKKR